jgi:hypothetical protein
MKLLSYQAAREPVSSQQTDPRSENDPLSHGLGTHPGLQLHFLLSGHAQGYRLLSHISNSNLKISSPSVAPKHYSLSILIAAESLVPRIKFQ